MKMDDIAKLAKVSKAAVSIALNGRPGVSDETRARVLAIAQENHYSPKHRQTKQDVKQILHFLTIDINGQKQRPTELPFFSSLIAEISVIAQRKKLTLQMSTLSETQLESWAKEINEEADDYLGTIVLATSLEKDHIETLSHYLQRLLILDTDYPQIAANVVAIDNYLGGYRAASALIEHGYTEIGYLRSEEQYPNFQERHRGFLARLSEAGIELAASYAIDGMSMQPSDQDQALFDKPMPRAIFCDNDYIAVRIIRQAQQQGIHIPQELAVIGFDDIAEGRVIDPDLTTIHVPVHSLAKVAVSRLRELAAGKLDEYNFKQLIEPRLVERHSI